jgi:S-adenosylmethionine:tRNA ribosyltransferase-isomerase
LFELEGSSSLAFLEQFGQMPLPPYISYTKEKEQRYQTHFAQEIGSAAAPTASLHFTPELLEHLQEKGVECSFSVLHVGLGTFKPVSVSDIRQHPIHPEGMIVDWQIFTTLVHRKRAKKNLIPV